MTLGNKWAYQVNDTYKTTQTVLHTLAAVASTGGSLLLDVGPMPTGELPPTALNRLAAVGKWMDVNAEAIHDTVPLFPYAANVTATETTEGPDASTQQWRLSRNADTVYAMLILNGSALPSTAAPFKPDLALPFVRHL